LPHLSIFPQKNLFWLTASKISVLVHLALLFWGNGKVTYHDREHVAAYLVTGKLVTDLNSSLQIVRLGFEEKEIRFIICQKRTESQPLKAL
jgi:hypothetical protein